jgi:hypothetical protein
MKSKKKKIKLESVYLKELCIFCGGLIKKDNWEDMPEYRCVKCHTSYNVNVERLGNE